MTIHADIVKALLHEWPTKKAVSDSLNARGHIIKVIDAALFAHQAVAPDDGKYSGRDFVRQVFLRHVRAMERDMVKALVFLMDISDLVPVEKKETQEKRKRDSSKVVPYPPGSRLVDKGVILPSGTLIPVNPPALMATPGMRFQAMRLAEEMMTTLVECSPPPGCVVIMDYEKEGPTAIFYNYATSLISEENKDSTAMRLPHHARKKGFGEADKAIGYWAMIPEFAELPLVAVSDDGDWLGVMMWMVRSTGREDVYIQRSRLEVPKKKEAAPPPSKRRKKNVEEDTGPAKKVRVSYYVHVNKAMGIMEGDMGWSISKFLLATILSGTDFLDKALVTNWISPNTIFRAVMYFSKHRADDFKQTWKTIDAFSSLLAFIYLVHMTDNPRGQYKKDAMDKCSVCKSDLKISLAQIRDMAIGKDSLKVPDQDTLVHVFKRVQFNVEYWGAGWRHVDVPKLVV